MIEKYNAGCEYMLITRAMSLKTETGRLFNPRIFNERCCCGWRVSNIEEDIQIQKQDIHAKVYMVRKYRSIILAKLNCTMLCMEMLSL